LIMDFTDAFREPPPDFGAPIEAVVSPTRTCVGVVVATAVALGAAIASGGRFVDTEIGMLGRHEWDPARFIDRARLRNGAGICPAARAGPSGRHARRRPPGR
jgi:hypothetical protein